MAHFCGTVVSQYAMGGGGLLAYEDQEAKKWRGCIGAQYPIQGHTLQ